MCVFQKKWAPLHNQYTAGEAELAAVEHKVAGLGNVAAILADGHFGGWNPTDACNNLFTAIETKVTQLKLLLIAQQFFFEVAEVLSWIAGAGRRGKVLRM